MIQLFKRILKKQSIYHIILICLLAFTLSAKKITDETVISMNGDMPRYLMNGVYFLDLLNDMPVTNPIKHAYHYFAQYPALSIGHHSPMLGVALVPFYAIFGVSVFSARLCVVFFIMIGAIALYLLVMNIYGKTAALLSSSLYSTTPFIIKYSRIVMPEIPSITLIIYGIFFLYRYRETNDRKYAFVSIFFIILGVFTKQLVIFILPVCILFYWTNIKDKELIKKDNIVFFIIIILLIVPLVFITLNYGKSHLIWLSSIPLEKKLSMDNLLMLPKILWKHQLTLPVLILSIISIFISIYKREKKANLFLLWIVCLFLLTAGLGIQNNPRYSIFWIPAFCVLSGSIVNFFSKGCLKGLIFFLLSTIVCYQFYLSYKIEPEYLNGYEQIAKYMTENLNEKTILYSGFNDSGYFIFFVRKHDPKREFIILRSDKILATSSFINIVEERVKTPGEIYGILEDFGIKYILVEDRWTWSKAINLLRKEVKSQNFTIIKRIKFSSSRKKFNNVDYILYEYKGYKPYQGGKILNFEVPLIKESIAVPLDEIVKKN